MRHLSRIRLVMLALVSAALAGAAAYGMTSVLHLGASNPKRPQPVAQATNPQRPVLCELSPLAALGRVDLPGFSQTVNEVTSTAPIKDGAAGGETDALVTDFEGGRLVGFLADVAIDGPDRPLEDAYDRSLGYTPGLYPLVPLSGAIVHDAPGVLEIYEFVATYRSPQGASEFTDWLRQGRLGAGGYQVQLRGLKQGAAYFQPAQGSGPHPPYEEEYQVVQELGTTVIRLDVEGGDKVNPSDAVRLANEASSRLRGACLQ